MTSRTAVGKEGEDLASGWLAGRGYHILRRNWRRGRYEIDIVAGRGKVLHVVEVKTRRSDDFGPPEQSVSRNKVRHLLRAAARWTTDFPGYARVQYDVLAITVRGGTAPDYFLVEDVYC